MTRSKAIALWTIVIIAIAAAAALTAYLHRRQPVTIRGAVLRDNLDPNHQLPLADVQITASNELGNATGQSDPAGGFALTLPMGLRRRQAVVLKLRRDGYEPLEVNDFIGDKVYVERMVSTHPDTDVPVPGATAISNARIRYSMKATTEANVGSAVKTFQVQNTANVPCRKRLPCSPGNKWRATLVALSLDAGEGNQFRNARASCIAGPCPFSSVTSEIFSTDRRRFNVSVINWSDTVTYLLEAEVVHPMTSDMIRETYPVIFGRALNFSLPASAEGPSLEAEVAGDAIIFPLGPDLYLRWADCQMVVDKDQSRNFRCELKPGYQFR